MEIKTDEEIVPFNNIEYIHDYIYEEYQKEKLKTDKEEIIERVKKYVYIFTCLVFNIFIIVIIGVFVFSNNIHEYKELDLKLRSTRIVEDHFYFILYGNFTTCGEIEFFRSYNKTVVCEVTERYPINEVHTLWEEDGVCYLSMPSENSKKNTIYLTIFTIGCSFIFVIMCWIELWIYKYKCRNKK